ncbi:MAG: AEC family transporter [Lachnospiraceae bacterium]|nr:AEC family transporter [Lachnospiraceae bacterium]
MFSVIMTQIIKMLLILFVGILVSRLHLIDDHANKALANLLLLVVNPIVAITALQTDYSPDLVRGLLISYALAILTHLVMIPVSTLLIRKPAEKPDAGQVLTSNNTQKGASPENTREGVSSIRNESAVLSCEKAEDNCAVERFAVIYSNCGFIGIPLVQSILGSEGVLYLTAYMTVFNIFSWTHGLGLMTKNAAANEKRANSHIHSPANDAKNSSASSSQENPDHASNPQRTSAHAAGSFSASARTLLHHLCTPMILASTLGLVLFFLQIKFPPILSDTLAYIGNMNTPLAMIIAGVSVSQVNIPAMLRDPRIYLVSFGKLLLMPAIVFVILLLVHVDSTVAYTILVAAACPCAATGTAFALKYHKNYAYSSELYAFSTLCSLITIPAFLYVAERLL